MPTLPSGLRLALWDEALIVTGMRRPPRGREVDLRYSLA
jgi:hypothetical protein